MTPTSLPPLLAADGLGMRFGRQALFDGLAFSWGPGAVALVGANGSGKSTLISLLCGIEKPSGGSIRIAGYDLAQAPTAAKARLAYVPDDSVAYGFMRGREFLAMADALRGRRDTAQAGPLASSLGLAPHMEKTFDTMSLGTRKKFMLLAGLMRAAPVTVMDEPTNGIDADAKACLASLIREAGSKRLFVFSTHDRELIGATGAACLRLGAAQD